MSKESDVSDTMFDILHAMCKDAGFLYDTIDTYNKDAQSANKTELVEIWQPSKGQVKTLGLVKRSLREGKYMYKSLQRQHKNYRLK